MDPAQRGPYAITECQIFSCPAQPNLVNKHFIILPPCFSFFWGRGDELIKFGMFPYVAHFD